MDYRERVTADYRVMVGKPVIKGTRITVELILQKLSQGATIENIVEMYPHLDKEDVLAALMYASAVIANEEIIDTPK
jgi:uncharacterized protein (DUF433 family)